MKTNKQKGFIVPLLIGIIAVLIIGGGAYIYTNKKVEKVETPATINSNLPATTTSIVYIDSTNGYQIKLPSDWTNYKVIDGEFLLPVNDKTWHETIGGRDTYGYASVFVVMKYNINDWNKMKESCGVPGGQNWARGCYEDNGEYTLGRNSTSIFVLDAPNAGPDDTQFATARREVMTANYLKNNFSIISSTSTTDATKDWKTYTDNQYGFSFQYPAEITFSSPVSTTRNAFTIDSWTSKTSSKDKPAVGLYISLISGSGEEALKNEENILNKQTYQSKNLQEIKIGGNSAIEESYINTTVSDTGGGGSHTANMLLETFNGRYLYSLQCSQNGISFYECNQILSTFKFTN